MDKTVTLSQEEWFITPLALNEMKGKALRDCDKVTAEKVQKIAAKLAGIRERVV